MQKRQRVTIVNDVVFPADVWLHIIMYLEWPEQLLIKLVCKRLFTLTSRLDAQISKQIMYCFKFCDFWGRLHVHLKRNNDMIADHQMLVRVSGLEFNRKFVSFKRMDGWKNHICGYRMISPEHGGQNRIYTLEDYTPDIIQRGMFIGILPNPTYAITQMLTLARKTDEFGCVCFRRYCKNSGARV